MTVDDLCCVLVRRSEALVELLAKLAACVEVDWVELVAPGSVLNEELLGEVLANLALALLALRNHNGVLT
jgi:hypothetical protein